MLRFEFSHVSKRNPRTHRLLLQHQLIVETIMCSHVWCVYSGKGNRVIKAWEYLVKKGQHDLQGQVQWPPFSVAMHNGLWFKMTKWSLKAKVNDPISILSESIPTCMFCAKVVKSLTSYPAYKSSLRTGRQMDVLRNALADRRGQWQ